MIIHENEIHIYQSTLVKTEAEIKYSEKILSTDELAKAYRFKFERDKNNYIACRAFLRNILSNYLSRESSLIDFSYSEKGKPFINNSPFKFNLSHSNNYAVYAFALDKEVGIDIEYHRELPDALAIAERYFSKNEIEELKKIKNEKTGSAFFYCWTRKEAFIKAVGDGLSYPLTDFSVTLDSDNAEILWIKNRPEEFRKWTLFNIKVKEGYTSSLAVKSNEMNIIYKKHTET